MTRQIPDRLEADGEGYFLLSLPAILPAGHPLWRRCAFLPGSSTAHYRGYVAQWLVQDGQLFLAGFGGRVARSDAGFARARRFDEEAVGRPIDMREVYECADPIPATWLSGDLRCHSRRGAATRTNDPMIPETFRLFRIVAGRVTGDVLVPNRDERVEIGGAEARARLDAASEQANHASGDGAHHGSPVRGLREAFAGEGEGPVRNAVAGRLWQAGLADLATLADGFARSEDPDLRRWIAYAAGRIGSEAAPLTALLADALATTKDTDGVEALAYALAGIGAPAARHLPAVIARVETVCGLHRIDQAARMIERVGEAGAASIDPLLGGLAAARAAETHGIVAGALGRIGPDALGPLLTAFQSAQGRQRASLAQAVGVIGPAAAPALGPLVEAIGAAPDDSERDALASALAAIGLRSTASLAPLGRALRQSRDPRTMRRIVEAMASLGPEAVGALMTEFEAARDPAALAALAEGLGKFGREAGAALDLLGAAAVTTDAALGAALAEALRAIGAPAAQVTTVQVTAAVLAPRAAGTEAILRSIEPGSAPPPAAIRDLVGLLVVYGESSLGRHIAGLLGAMGAAAVDPLVAVLPDTRDRPVGLLVLHALGLIGPPAAAARGVFVDALTNARDDRARLQLTDGLRRIGPADEAHLTRLIAVLRQSGFAPVWWRLALAIAEIGPPAVGPLVALLEETSSEDRRRALGNALGEMGASAVDAAPALMAAMRTTRDPRTREILASALRRTALRLT